MIHDLSYCFSPIELFDTFNTKQLKIRKDVVFVILNTKSQIMRIIPQIMAQGVPLKNILGINTLTYNNN